MAATTMWPVPWLMVPSSPMVTLLVLVPVELAEVVPAAAA
jgi:hypothetical protein